MPLFSTSLPQQQTAFSAGKKIFPDIGAPSQYAILIEEFAREELNPSGAPVLYTLTGIGAPSITYPAFDVTIATSANTNDTADLRTSGILFRRVAQDSILDLRTSFSMDIKFYNFGNTNYKWFLGLSGKIGNPTFSNLINNPNLGIYCDTTVNNNLQLISGDNNSINVTTNTGISGIVKGRLNILWNDINSAVISLFDQTDNLISTQNVTSIGNGIGNPTNNSMQLHLFCQTLENVAKSSQILGWTLKST